MNINIDPSARDFQIKFKEVLTTLSVLTDQKVGDRQGASLMFVTF